jgi:hypothetical protein
MLLRILRNVHRNTALQRKGMEIVTFEPTAAGEMLLKAVGQQLGTDN